MLYGWLNGGAIVTKCGFFILESPFSTVKKFSRHTVTRGIVQILFAILATLSTLTQPLFYGSLYYNGLSPLRALVFLGLIAAGPQPDQPSSSGAFRLI